MPDKKLEEIINRILQVIKPDKIILFGSRARGEGAPDSDYDLMIVKSDIEDELIVERKLYKNFLGLGVGIDIIVTTTEKLEKHKNTIGYIYKEVWRDGVVVYGQP